MGAPNIGTQECREISRKKLFSISLPVFAGQEQPATCNPQLVTRNLSAHGSLEFGQSVLRWSRPSVSWVKVAVVPLLLCTRRTTKMLSKSFHCQPGTLEASPPDDLTVSLTKSSRYLCSHATKTVAPA